MMTITTTTRRLTATTLGLALAATAAAGVSSTASASTSPTATSQAMASERGAQRQAGQAAPAGGLTAAQMREVAASARTAGDTGGARAAEQVAARLQSSGPQAENPFVAIAKKAIQAVLQHGGSKLPGRFGKYAKKMDSALAKVDDLEEAGLAAAFQQAGMPPHIAADAAKWCATFVI